MHEKLVPSAESAEHVDVWGLEDVPDLSINIVLTAGKPPIAASVDVSMAQSVALTPVLSLPEETVPKSASGSIPPKSVQQGASIIHSADDRSASDTAAPAA